MSPPPLSRTRLRLADRPARQRGAALLMAMVIVTLVATLSATMVWQQWRAVQVEGAERVRTQAQWVLVGALDWARLILKEDVRNGGADHLGEAWATPLAEARLSTFLASDKDNTDDAPEAFLSGKVDDVTAHYNLRNLIDANGEVDPKELNVLRRLCEYTSLSPSLADGVAQAYRKAWLAQQASDAAVLAKLGGEQALNAAPLMPQSMDQLTWLGLDAGTVERLRPYLTLLPDASGVNVNTAPKEVIAAVVDKMDLGTAERLVQARQRSAFKDPSEILKVLGATSLDLGRLRVTSDFFEVRGRLRLEDNVIEQRHLVQRVGTDVIVRSQTRFSGLDQGGARTGGLP
ncbi:type II secretion system minor pseudopilin GspK [Aquabacterium sp.]|uniref:type II secretion system minor pseudopilin GspK n=1 Tax=Aquabacterium sp. TaxID=1872578 RepID=UPI0025C38705|nr:type II secretion system minor pseudopilin GspK [Aquabacterium sp.]